MSLADVFSSKSKQALDRSGSLIDFFASTWLPLCPDQIIASRLPACLIMLLCTDLLARHASLMHNEATEIYVRAYREPSSSEHDRLDRSHSVYIITRPYRQPAAMAPWR